MARKKSTVERQLSNAEIDEALSKIQFKTQYKAKLFYKITEQLWYRQYAKGSKEALNKITLKVKKGIEQQKYVKTDLGELDDGWKRFVKPKPQKKLKKVQKKLVKAQQKITEKKTRKKREIIKQTERRAPSGRLYSPTEIREGIGSKRAIAYREKHGIDKKDWSK